MKTTPPSTWRSAASSGSPVWVAVMLIAFYVWTGPFDRGNALVCGAALDTNRLFSGEVWRLVSFILIPPLTPGHPVTYVFIFFILFIGFRMGDSLELAWGEFRTSLYCYGLFICQIVANLLLGLLASTLPIAWGGILFYEALFFAFATVYPKFEFRAMLLFPSSRNMFRPSGRWMIQESSRP